MNDVPNSSNTDVTPVASHSSTSGNPVEQDDNCFDDDFDDYDDFEECSKCDGHPACRDFGCAIKAGIRIYGDNF
jgi:hypothetical protein